MTYLIPQLEIIVPVVAKWASDTVIAVTRALSPEGLPFGFVEQTDAEQLQEYFQYRDNPEAWAAKLGEVSGDIVKRLTDSQLTPEQIQSVHPMDIASKFLIKYSYDMEMKLEQKRGNNA